MHGPFLDTQASRRRREAAARRRRARRRLVLAVLGAFVVVCAVLAGTAGDQGTSPSRAVSGSAGAADLPPVS